MGKSDLFVVFAAKREREIRARRASFFILVNVSFPAFC
jgi:hypothetical protein